LAWGELAQINSIPRELKARLNWVTASFWILRDELARKTLNQFGQATPPADTFTQVSAGEAHTCAIKSDGIVTCWRNNDYGQLLANKIALPLIMH